MSRRRDRLIDKKIGSVIRMQRVKLGMSQGELGKGLGVTFQQIQKYENGTNAVASTRIPESYAGDWVTRSIRRRGEPTF
jgi:transcriptional regulator with XRE-family HTH domain